MELQTNERQHERHFNTQLWEVKWRQVGSSGKNAASAQLTKRGPLGSQLLLSTTSPSDAGISGC